MHKKKNKATLGMHARAEKNRFFLLYHHQKATSCTYPKTKHYRVLLQLLELPFPASQSARTTEKKLRSENEAIFLTTRCFSATLCTATPATLAALPLHLRHYRAPRLCTSSKYYAGSISTKQVRRTPNLNPNPTFLHCLILSFFLAHIQDEEEGDGEEGEENLAHEEEESSKPSPQIFSDPSSSQSKNLVASGMPDTVDQLMVAFFVMMNK